jgi:hypothetical protein
MGKNMKHIVLSIVVVALFIQVLQAQEYTYLPSLKDQLLYGPLELQIDSLPQAPKRKLLPDNMSFMEKGLWGEDGIFRSIGLAAPLTPESRKSELALRRTMLTAHQIGGFVTLWSMITAVYFGQLLINNGDRGYRKNHQIFVTTTIISYSATGLLAVLSPPPMIRRNEMSTTTIHKTLAWVHFAGMVLTPIIGLSVKRHGTISDVAHFHQASAYITTAALATSLIIITF